MATYLFPIPMGLTTVEGLTTLGQTHFSISKPLTIYPSGHYGPAKISTLTNSS